MRASTPESSERLGSVSKVKQRLVVAAIILGLVALVWIAFGRAVHYEFINYDDNEYVYENPKVASGLSFGGILWAFTHTYSANWHPLTTISHMMDCQVYGLQPWGHHLTNVLLHATAAVLLFLALRALTSPALSRDKSVRLTDRTGNIWASAFVAALFAVHPLRVESVAWISERKDVLSGVFFMLTLLAYASYAKSGQRSLAKYAMVMALFALGLLCKPTLVTLPFVFLLLDYWPLRRFSNEPVKQLIWEKIPLFILSILSCLATISAQGAALEGTKQLTLVERASNALASYFSYLCQLIYPRHLAVLYPYRTDVAVVSQLIPIFLFLTLLSIMFFLWRKRYPFLLIGWLWFLGTMIPMIGLVQVGSQAHADRYTYLTQIGLYILIAWGAIELFGHQRRGRTISACTGLLVITALTAWSYQETSNWKDAETLWRHALSTTFNNYIAHNNLGSALTQHGQFPEAILHFEEASRLRPDYAEAYNNLGNALLDSDAPARKQKPLELEAPTKEAPENKNLERAIDNYKKSIAAKPTFAEAWTNLGTALLQKGERNDAMESYRKALELSPDLPEANGNIANAFLEEGKINDAVGYYEKAIELKPNYADAHYGLSKALLQNGKPVDAMKHLQEVIAIEPRYPEAYHNIAVILAQGGDLNSAIDQYRKAISLRPDYAQAENNLGNALLRKGQIDESIVHLQKAVAIVPSYAEPYNDLGSAFMQKRQITQAINYYLKALHIDPTYAEAHSNLGNAYLQNAEVDNAIAQDKAAVTLYPQSAPMQYNLGNALVSKGNLTDGMACYRKALELQPNYTEVHNKLAMILAAGGKTDEALQEFNEALRTNANYAETHYNLGRLLIKLGRRGEAIAHLTEALRLKPSYVDAQRQLRDLGVSVPQ